MGWMSLSLRKMVLTQRVSELEHRLTKLSQEEQTLANSSSYAERAIAVEKTQAYNTLNTDYTNKMNSMLSQFNTGQPVTDMSVLAQYNTDLQTAQLGYMYNKMNIDSIFTAKEEAMQDEINERQTQIDLEQEQLETQLEAARAEKEQLDKAISEDIKSSTISLV